MRYLVVAAHPDDEVLGAGATIAKLTAEGNPVAVAIMVSRAAARAKLSDTLSEDEAAALKVLGVERTFHADFPNIRMNTVPHLELVQFIEQCITEFSADAIITHHPADTNNDHVMTAHAAIAACRLFQRRPNIPKLQRMMYMEVPSSTEWALDSSASRFQPNFFTEIGESGLAKKLEALAKYKGVILPFPHPRSVEAIRGLAAYRGGQSGCEFAEAFEIVYERG